ncbi:MAG: hypothetical protein E5V66_34000 [Mesorhizobium sp.]|uniref:hypothetical protein n=1 Tax=Mesorhizobium sp. TaxID=1871066 RepID=UPI00120042C6|nr:hypothetical protein [Mesorhizobium sp.]TIU66520.1 MAG: hypothetical protein E5W25_17850 [Mesorhizobium sp.]TIW06591.1 MAG: hypothetical protein E5V66_34000 [Mesorhizobium sp.]TIX64907.1 MAG: hypothetical protein E5V30_28275 [Mesorhizobium sp.]
MLTAGLAGKATGWRGYIGLSILAATWQKTVRWKQKLPSAVPVIGGTVMWPAIDNGDERKASLKLLAERLTRETGLKEEEVKRLIELIGTDWNSLLR